MPATDCFSVPNATACGPVPVPVPSPPTTGRPSTAATCVPVPVPTGSRLSARRTADSRRVHRCRLATRPTIHAGRVARPGHPFRWPATSLGAWSPGRPVAMPATACFPVPNATASGAVPAPVPSPPAPGSRQRRRLACPFRFRRRPSVDEAYRRLPTRRLLPAALPQTIHDGRVAPPGHPFRWPAQSAGDRRSTGTSGRRARYGLLPGSQRTRRRPSGCTCTVTNSAGLDPPRQRLASPCPVPTEAVC